MNIKPLTQQTLDDAVNIVLQAELDTREEIEHHLQHLNAHWIALENNKVIGVIGWYQDNVHYADTAMGNNFPGEEAYWVGFFAVNKNYRGQGIGKQLLDTLETSIKQKNQSELWVSSVPETKTYYEHHGFVLVCQGDINNNHKFFMKKQL